MARIMKNSGIAWLGDIPDTWGIGKISFFFDIQLGKMLQPDPNGEEDTFEDYLCAANLGGNKLKIDVLKQMWFSPSDKAKFGVLKGDLLVVEGGDVASCDVVTEDVHNLYIQNALHRVRSKNGFDVRLLRYLLIIAKTQGYIDLICNKATIAHFTKEKLASIPYPVIPLEEQVLIANFLDTECAHIDSVIEQTRASIEEYKKLKQAVITQAVTKGIRPNRSMKNSGIEWIGEIPADWKCIKFKYFATVKSNIVQPDGYANYPQVSPENIEKGTGKLLPCKTVAEVGVISGNHLFYKGQILYSKIRPKLNKVTIAPFDGLCSADMYPIETILNKTFLVYALRSDSFLANIGLITEDRVKMPKINQEELANIFFAVPPIIEQDEIVEYLGEKSQEIDSLITKKEAFISELEAYKKSLIYEYVTGKKEVS